METLATPNNIWSMIHSYVKWCLEQDGRKGEKYTLKIEPKEIDEIIEEVERQVHWEDDFDDWIHYCNWEKWRECETYGASYFESMKYIIDEWVVEDGETGVFVVKMDDDDDDDE
tara:strand:- start:794 stop:1135 length:342 start_codon:yes stop_codon:yes gene_type:complete